MRMVIKKHWFCCTKKEARVLKRKAKSGCWRSGRVRDVVVGPGGKVVVETRNRFIWGILLRVHSGLIGFLFIILRLCFSCVGYLSSLTKEIAFQRMF